MSARRVDFRLFSLPLTLGVGSSLSAVWGHGRASCEGHQNNERIAVYLKPESKELLQNTLKKHKYISDPIVDYVCINPCAVKEDVHVYKPLFGNRTAFRLKSLIFLEDGTAIGMGRVSNMAGEIKDSSAEVAVPIFSGKVPSDPARVQELLDLPTRLLDSIRSIDTKPAWKGRIRPGKVGDRKYDALSGVSFVRVPFEKQVVVEGYLCSNLCVNSEGKCEYEPVMQQAVSEANAAEKAAPTQPSPVANRKDPAQDQADGAEDPNECPICRYMKAGECREEFLVWDACLKGLKEDEEVRICYEPTKAMLLCARQYEYYDILVAGMDIDKYLALQMPAQAKESSLAPK